MNLPTFADSEQYFEHLNYDYDQVLTHLRALQSERTLNADELCAQGLILYRMAQFSAAERTLTAAANQGSELAVIELSAVQLALYKFADALETIEAARQTVSPRWASQAQMRHGIIQAFTGHLTQGLTLVEGAYQEFVVSRNRRGIEEAASYLGCLHVLAGDTERAQHYLQASLKAGESQGDLYLRLDTLTRLLVRCVMANDHQGAVAAVDTARIDFARLPRSVGVFYYYQAGLRETALGFMRGENLQFLTNIFGFKEVVEDRSYDNLEAVFWFGAMLMDAFIKTGDNYLALDMVNMAFPDETYRTPGNRAFEAVIAQKMGDYARAQELLEANLQRALQGGYWLDRIRCELYLADNMYKTGRPGEAIELLWGTLQLISAKPVNFIIRNDLANVAGLIAFAKSLEQFAELITAIEQGGPESEHNMIRIKGVGRPLIIFGDIQINWKLDAVSTSLVLLYIRLHPNSTIQQIAENVLTEKFVESKAKAETYVRQIIHQIRKQFGDEAILVDRPKNKTLPGRFKVGDNLMIASDYDFIFNHIVQNDVEAVLSVYNAPFAVDHPSTFTDLERGRMQDAIYGLICDHVEAALASSLLAEREARMPSHLLRPETELMNATRWLQMYLAVHPSDERASDLLRDLRQGIPEIV